MCRLAAFPPGFPRDDAISILKAMEGGNRDGVGYAYVRPDKQFAICKYPGSLSRVLESKKRSKFLSHMPYNGWTIAHLRMATHGDNTPANTHPFQAGDWCVAHNGVWNGYRLARLAMGNTIKWEGETDSEVAAHLINIAGPKLFSTEVTAGAFVALNRNGEMWAILTSGRLCWSEWNGLYFVVTDLPEKHAKLTPFPDGWHRFLPSGGVGGWSGGENPKKSTLTHPVKIEYSKRFGANVYVNAQPGADEPPQGKILHLDEDGHWEGDDYYLDQNDGRYHKRGEKIVVPRDPGVILDADEPESWDNLTEEEWKRRTAKKFGHENLPRHPPLPVVEQTTVPKLNPA